MLDSTTVALKVTNTHIYKPRSCRCPDDICFPEMTGTSMTPNDVQERPARESELSGYRAENHTEAIPPYTYVHYTRIETYESTLHKSSATEHRINCYALTFSQHFSKSLDRMGRGADEIGKQEWSKGIEPLAAKLERRPTVRSSWGQVKPNKNKVEAQKNRQVG